MTKEEILNAVLEEHGLTYEDVTSVSRKGILPDVRSQYIYLCEALIKDKGIKSKWLDICLYIGYTDHSMYWHSMKKANALIDTDSVYRIQITRIRTKLIRQPVEVAFSNV